MGLWVVKSERENARVASKKNKGAEVPADWLPLFQWNEHYHYKQQMDFTRAIENYWEVVFLAGNGTGKTHMLYWTLICIALGIHPHFHEKPPIHIKVLLNDFEHGYGKIFSETCLYDQYMFDGNVLGPMLKESPYMVTKWPSRDDKSLHFYNKSVMFFQTSEQKKKQHSGTNFDILACDEEPIYQIYDESRRGLRTAKGGGRILHAFTPPFDEEDKQRGPSWTKFKLIDPWEQGLDTDTMVIKAAMHDNPAITEDYIRKFSKGKTEEQIRIQVYGDYPTWGEMVHPDFQDFMWDPKAKTGHLLPHDFQIPWGDSDVMFEMSIDWHSSKPPAVVWSFEYLTGPNKGDVVFFDEISPLEGKGMTISDCAKAIREHEGYRNIRIRRWADPKMRDKNNALISGFNAWEEFRHCGIRCVEGNNRHPEVRVACVNDYLRGRSQHNMDHPRAFVTENCKSIRHNMKNHYWKKKEDGIGTPDGKFSDYCINVGYILHPKSRRVQKNLEKSKFGTKWGVTSFDDPDFKRYRPRQENRWGVQSFK